VGARVGVSGRFGASGGGVQETVNNRAAKENVARENVVTEDFDKYRFMRYSPKKYAEE
jgi:hypothetical protein